MTGIRGGIKRGVKFLQLLNAREFAFCSGSFWAVCIMREEEEKLDQLYLLNRYHHCCKDKNLSGVSSLLISV